MILVTLQDLSGYGENVVLATDAPVWATIEVDNMFSLLLVAAFAVSMFSTALATASAKSPAKATKKVKCKKGYVIQTGIRNGKKVRFCVKPSVKSGKNGINGTNGVNGRDGATGATGATGSQGVKGDTGSTGATGATGAQGVQGIQGAKGDAADGYDGMPSSA